jgi:hypothetical protein
LPGVLDHSGAQAALRAQILATEHWSLLATRGMTWSEIFSRTGISIASQALGAVAALQIAIGLLAALGSERSSAPLVTRGSLGSAATIARYSRAECLQ